MQKCIATFIGCSTVLIGLLEPGSCIAAPLQMVGAIDSHYAIEMNIDRDGSVVKGTYRYLPKGGNLVLVGKSDPSGNIELTESAEHGAKTGLFKGRIVGDKRIVGTWMRQKDQQIMPFLVALKNDPHALDGGKDGIIICEEKKHIPKPKSDTVRNPTFVSYPLVMKQSLDDQKAANQLQNSLSLDTVFGTKNIVRDALNGTDTWTEEISYNVHYNKNYLVDAEYTMSGVAAYPDQSTREVVINTKTGRRVTAEEAFGKSSLPELKRMVNALMQQAIKQAKQDNASDKEAAQSLEELLSGHQLTLKDLDNFAINEKGVTFLYHWGFPHVAQALEPDGQYFIPYTKLVPLIRREGPLSVFAGK